MLALLAKAADSAIPLMASVASPGVLQVHRGLVRGIQEQGLWLKLVGPGFTLRLRAEAIDTVWLVGRTAADREVFSVEFYNRQGGKVALLFGKPEGDHDAIAWRDGVHAVESSAL